MVETKTARMRLSMSEVNERLTVTLAMRLLTQKLRNNPLAKASNLYKSIYVNSLRRKLEYVFGFIHRPALSVYKAYT